MCVCVCAEKEQEKWDRPRCGSRACGGVLKWGMVLGRCGTSVDNKKDDRGNGTRVHVWDRSRCVAWVEVCVCGVVACHETSLVLCGVVAVPPVGNDRLMSLIHPGGVMVAAGLRVWLVPQGILEKRV